MIKKYLLLGFSFQLIFLIGCGSDTYTVHPPAVIHNNETCSPSINWATPHTVKFQHFYMDGFPLISNNKGRKLTTAFFMRSGIIIVYDSSAGRKISHTIINTGTGSDIPDTLGSFAYRTRDVYENTAYPQFVCGIDSLTNFGSLDPRVIGLSVTEGTWSFAFVGRIKRAYDTAWTSAAEGCLAHEMGHQIHIDSSGHTTHSGNDAATCIMHAPLNLNYFYYPVITFCDSHGCELWNSTSDYSAGSYNNLPKNYKHDNNFEITLSLDKSSYLEAENIIINVKIKNIGYRIDTIKNLSGSSLESNMNLFKGERLLPYTGIDVITSGDSYYIFKPGEEFNYSFRLQNCYGFEKQEAFNESKRTYLAPGKYNVSLYNNYECFGKTLVSNTLSFEVVKPTDKNYDALLELRQIYKVVPSTELTLMYRDFVYKYSESPYIDQAFEGYLSIRLGTDENKYSDMIIKDCKWFIDSKPNSTSIPLVMKNCVEMIEKYQSKDDVLDYLNKIATLYFDKRAGKEAQKLTEKQN